MKLALLLVLLPSAAMAQIIPSGGGACSPSRACNAASYSTSGTAAFGATTTTTLGASGAASFGSGIRMTDGGTNLLECGTTAANASSTVAACTIAPSNVLDANDLIFALKNKQTADGGTVFKVDLEGDPTGGAFSGTSFTSSAGSGSNGLACSTNGARVDFGAGASDYASSNGTTVTFAGPLATSGAFTWGTSSDATGGSVSSNTMGSLVNQTLNLKGWVADGAGAVGVVIDNQTTLSTSGAKILSIRNNTSEKASIDKDGAITSGVLSVTGTAGAFGITLNNANISPVITYSTSGTVRGYIGAVFANDALAAGTAAGGMIIRSQDKPLYISLNGAGSQTVQYSFGTGGAFFQKPGTLPTCDSTLEGTRVMVAGSAGALTKDCVCTYDGTTARWVNTLTNSGGTGRGDTTTCPAT